jgi:leader peptidase (prepilin peptidase)/N-methyltransferase
MTVERVARSTGAAARAKATPFATRLALAAAAAAVLAASLTISFDLRGALGAALGWLMLAIAHSDARRYVVPDALVAAALALGLVDAAVASGGGLEAPAIAAAQGALAAAALLAIELIYRRLRGRPGLGLGDVKLAGVAGAWLSASSLPAAIELAALAALLAYAARQIRKRRQFRSRSRLPFAAFLAPSIWLVWLFETWARSL